MSAVGDGVTQWQVGDRVIVPAGRDLWHLRDVSNGSRQPVQVHRVLGVDVDGAQAGAVAVPAALPLPIPGHVPFAQAAILADAVATPYHALKRGGAGEGTVAVVIGMGGLGFHAVQLAVLAGAEVVGIDTDDVALQRGLEAGAFAVVNANDDDAITQVLSATDGGGDVSFEFVGITATVALASRVLRPGGRATLVGIGRDRLTGPPLGVFVSREQEVVGSFGATLADVNELVDLLDAGRLDLSRSVSHTFGIEEVPTAIQMLHTREGNPLRIVIDHTR